MAALSNDLKLAEEVYVKFQRRSRGEDEYLLGFMTPYDKDKGEVNRKSTVDHWAQGWGKQDLIDKQALVCKNEPMEGFKLLHSVGRSQTENKVWRIEDPRGFELEIMTENLSYLLNYVNIVDRVMTGKLIWSTRVHGGTNWLIPAVGEDYEQVMQFTTFRREARGQRLSLRDVNRGDIVLLHDARKVRYLGGMYSMSKRYNGYITRDYYFEVLEGSTPRWDAASTGLDKKSSVKVGKIVEASDPPLTKEEAEKVANDLLTNATGYGLSNFRFLCADKFEKDDVEFVMKDGQSMACVNGREFVNHP